MRLWEIKISKFSVILFRCFIIGLCSIFGSRKEPNSYSFFTTDSNSSSPTSLDTTNAFESAHSLDECSSVLGILFLRALPKIISSIIKRISVYMVNLFTCSPAITKEGMHSYRVTMAYFSVKTSSVFAPISKPRNLRKQLEVFGVYNRILSLCKWDKAVRLVERLNNFVSNYTSWHGLPPRRLCFSRYYTLCILGLLLFFAPSAFSQGSQFQSILLGPTGRPLSGAQITVCAYGSTGIPCQSPINLFSDPGLSIPMTNPTKSDSLGNWGFWALPNNYVYTVTGTGVVSSGPFIISVPCNLNSSCSGTTSTFAGLPVSPVTNALAIVTDGNGNNCLGGGGTIRELCQWTGTVWVLISAPISANFPITAANGGTGTATPIAHGTAVAQGVGTPFNFVLPTSNDQCYMADHTSFATIDPSFRTCPSGGGGGSPSAG